VPHSEFERLKLDIISIANIEIKKVCPKLEDKANRNPADNHNLFVTKNDMKFKYTALWKNLGNLTLKLDFLKSNNT
jgi:hypothetical protein